MPGTPWEKADTRFDRDVERAWREFRVRLADHVAAMRDGDGLVLEPLAEESAGPAGPCVQFYAWDGGQVRCEVPSDAHLDGDRHLSSTDRALLTDLGLQEPTRGPDDPEDGGSPAYWMDRPTGWSDELAAVSVRALREIWGVPHPLFLRIETFGPGRTPTFEAVPTVSEAPGAPALPVAVEPTGEDHLRELVEATVQRRIGAAPPWDDDGDIVLRVAGVLLFVGIGQGSGTVDLFAPIVHTITGRTRAAEVVADLNRRWPHLKFVLVEDRVAVALHLQSSPFVPAHLLSGLDRMAEFLETLDVEFATHLGGELLREPDHVCAPDDDEDPPWSPDSEEDLPLALLALRDFHQQGAVEIQVKTVAAIGDNEPTELQRFLAMTVEQQVGWECEALERAAAGDDDGVEAADARALEWELTGRSLTAALRFLDRPAEDSERTAAVKRHRQARPAAPDQPALFDDPDEPTLFD
ncbi:T3SS (YopN, CesT) and YbjN peptide-binding chaperone 1 [Rhodococcus phenolicus]|uniref:T3SS (YopN, CesT) and YbjN peptide-binding chaperone 1 n=1 Tax=Rhodococcus phenolicus TaxID=263849 RepID=UPI000836F0DE|nr:hypothetical protein [Rhodococcus phenolicus]